MSMLSSVPVTTMRTDHSQKSCLPLSTNESASTLITHFKTVQKTDNSLQALANRIKTANLMNKQGKLAYFKRVAAG